jgi:hypothetical protein
LAHLSSHIISSHLIHDIKHLNILSSLPLLARRRRLVLWCCSVMQ